MECSVRSGCLVITKLNDICPRLKYEEGVYNSAYIHDRGGPILFSTKLRMIFVQLNLVLYVTLSSMFAHTSLRSQQVALITGGRLLKIHSSDLKLVNMSKLKPYKAHFRTLLM